MGGALAVAMVVLGTLPARPAAQASFRNLFIVAHQDDDLLFMNPAIQESIAAGHTVKVVYVTAGDACIGTKFMEERETGVKAAYAKMARVSNRWTLSDRPIREIKLAGRARVSLVFFRLPSTASEDGGPCESGESLERLWKEEISAVTALDGTHTFGKQELIDSLGALINDFHPNRINTLDSGGSDGVPECNGVVDPSKCVVDYPGFFPYYYDHSDHYHSALFAVAAVASYARSYDYWGYRGYNIALLDANVDGEALARKQAIFGAYAINDFSIGTADPPFGVFYDPWLARQYVAH